MNMRVWLLKKVLGIICDIIGHCPNCDKHCYIVGGYGDEVLCISCKTRLL
jgi:hypothetical protein